MTKAIRGGAVVLAVLVGSGRAIAQQGQDAAIVGRVVDASGGALVNASVSVASPALIGGVRSVTTNDTGGYRIVSLAPGEYTASAAFTGLTTERRPNLILLAGATITVDFVLAPQGVEASV